MSTLDFAASMQLLSAAVIPMLFGIALHEAAHGWMARQLGDRTAELLGRITANPLKHIDPVGTVAVPLILTIFSFPPFGWAKPVPVNARNLRNPTRDMLLVAAAGPGSNFLMAAFWALVLTLASQLPPALTGARQFLDSMAQIGITFNVLLAIFNLIPIPPLDGGRVLRGLVPEGFGRKLDAVEPYGLILLMVLLVQGVLGRLVWPLVQAVSAKFILLAGV